MTSDSKVIVVNSLARWVHLQRVAGVVAESPSMLRDTVSGCVYVTPPLVWQTA